MKKIAFLSIVIILLVILSSCTSDFKVDENIVEDITDKLTEKIVENTGDNRVEKTETHTLDASNSIDLVVNSSVGDINVTSNNSSEVIIDANIVANSKNKDTAKKALENYSYVVESNSSTIKVDTSQNMNELINGGGISVDLNIKVPATIKTIRIANNVGDTTINNSNATYNIKTDVGEIDLDNCHIVGKSEFNTNTGDIKISTNDISDAENIFVETQVGDINISLPESSSYKADINEFMEKQRFETKGNGKTNIKLVTNVGSIDFK